ncbi:7809_t:CDS:1 [Paraglomus brasilianum]|uniref:7809_t:CDS:1 n=1 Tax=Paraglomus brasilianum TaxID=144538 RepID=A0A9N9F5D6_9GLOM|nr:7809_t:CDS:1 [Paraglomus brasilianum]
MFSNTIVPISTTNTAVISKKAFITSLLSLPNEILHMIFEMLDIASLFAVSDTCKLFNLLSYEYIIQSFESPELTLRLSFNQEYKLKPQVEFHFSHVDESSNNLVFKPTTQKQIKFYNSAVVHKPTLYNAALTTDNNEVSRLSKENFLQKASPLSIKNYGTFNETHKIHRDNHPLSYTFKYTVSTTPENIARTRSGERWVTPEEFSCPIDFFYPQGKSISKIFTKLFGKQRQNKAPTKKLSKRKWRNNKAIEAKKYEETNRSVPTPVSN